jgi:hypothetical protein
VLDRPLYQGKCRLRIFFTKLGKRPVRGVRIIKQFKRTINVRTFHVAIIDGGHVFSYYITIANKIIFQDSLH